jgi:transcriptional regulator with XRE-family HTH domain
MSKDQALNLRTKILGVLLRDARLSAGKSMKDLGDVIGVSGGSISSFERGVKAPTLPELELLAFYLDMPISHFWSDDTVSDSPHPSQQLEVGTLLELRDSAIGTLLRMARDKKGISQKDLGQETGISTSRIRRYEGGESGVPLPELERLARALEIDLGEFSDIAGPVGDWLVRQKARQAFDQLPENMRSFVSNPENLPYLEMAQRMSVTPIERLRAVAKGILDFSDE